jgi:hypothetical protein
MIQRRYIELTFWNMIHYKIKEFTDKNVYVVKKYNFIYFSVWYMEAWIWRKYKQAVTW